MRILWVKAGPLLPLDTGGKKRSHAMLTELSKEHQITYLALHNPSVPLLPAEMSDPYASDKEWVPWNEAPKRSFAFGVALIRNLASTLPYALVKYRSASLQKRLHESATQKRFDLVVCDFLAPALNFLKHRFQAPTILFQHNMEAQIWKRMAAAQKSPFRKAYFSSQYRRMRFWEGKLSRIFSGVITVSPEDTQHARQAYGLANVLGDVPTGVDINYFRPPSAGDSPPSAQSANPDFDLRRSPSALSAFPPFTFRFSDRPPPSALRPPVIGFLGSMDWLPNIDSVSYFVRDILPLVCAVHPGVRFKVIGRNPPAQILRLATENPAIEITGTVDDIRPHVRQCQVIVVPLRSGGGTRIKIFEAMAMGVPVVSTTIGAEGLPVTHQENILLADDPLSFAAELNRLAQDPDLGRRIAANALQKVQRDHSWSAAAQAFQALCSRVCPMEPVACGA